MLFSEVPSSRTKVMGASRLTLSRTAPLAMPLPETPATALAGWRPTDLAGAPGPTMIGTGIQVAVATGPPVGVRVGVLATAVRVGVLTTTVGVPVPPAQVRPETETE